MLHIPFIYDLENETYGHLLWDHPLGYWGGLVASDKFIGDLRARFEAAGIWEDMTLVLSSDNGYRGPETHIKRDPENRVPLIAKLGGAPKGLCLQGTLKCHSYSRNVARDLCRTCETDRRPCTLFPSRCNVRIDQFAPDDCGHSVEMSRVVPSYGFKLFRVKNFSASANMTWRPRARPSICPVAKCCPCRVRDMPTRRTERKRRELKSAIRNFYLAGYRNNSANRGHTRTLQSTRKGQLSP